MTLSKQPVALGSPGVSEQPGAPGFAIDKPQFMATDQQPVAFELPCVGQQPGAPGFAHAKPQFVPPVALGSPCVGQQPGAAGFSHNKPQFIATDQLPAALELPCVGQQPGAPGFANDKAQFIATDQQPVALELLCVGQQPGAPGFANDKAQFNATGQQPVALAHDCADVEPNARTAVPSLNSLFLQKKLGRGTFGDVYKCEWKGLSLAVKIRRNSDRKSGRADKEISILKHVANDGGHPSIIRLEAWRNASAKLFLFFQCCDTDLRKVISDSASRSETMSAQDASCVARSMCSALAYLQSSLVIHRDLKPANILLRKKTSRGGGPSAKLASSWRWSPLLCDFGNATLASRALRFSDSQWPACGGPPLELGAATRRVTTLWYAAPEMLMLRGRYSFGVDVWALGLVLAEMENNGPVCPTKPGASEWDQLLEARVMCQPEATSSPFTRMAQKDLLCRYPHRALGPKLQRGALGRVYGARFRAVAASCLQFVPAQRATAIALAEAYQSDCGEVLWPCRLGFFWPYRSQWRQRQGS